MDVLVYCGMFDLTHTYVQVVVVGLSCSTSLQYRLQADVAPRSQCGSV